MTSSWPYPPNYVSLQDILAKFGLFYSVDSISKALDEVFLKQRIFISLVFNDL